VLVFFCNLDGSVRAPRTVSRSSLPAGGSERPAGRPYHRRNMHVSTNPVRNLNAFHLRRAGRHDAFWTSPLLLIFPGRMIGESMGRHGSWIGAKRRARARPHLQCRTGDSCAAGLLSALLSSPASFLFPVPVVVCDRRSRWIRSDRNRRRRARSRNICTARRGRGAARCRFLSSFFPSSTRIRSSGPDDAMALLERWGPPATLCCLPMAPSLQPK